MPKARDVFVCRSCGGVQSRWMGKCPDCSAWGSLEQERIDSSASKDPQRGLIEAWQAEGAGDPASGSSTALATASTALPIAEVKPGIIAGDRLATGISELDRVLGGGLVRGSAVLVGGDPGIGKSTLMLQAAGAIARKSSLARVGSATRGEGDERHGSPSGPVPTESEGAAVLYVSAEESAEQIRMRAARLNAADAPGLYVLADTNLARIVEQVRRLLPRVVIIDSIQMIYKADLDASPGSVAQLRRCCSELVYLAKVSGIAVVLVGHVTKDGQLAGPRLLEHLVDAVIYFEGDRYHSHRILRAVKNRFGTTLEIGVFEMTGAGLHEVSGGLSRSLLDEMNPGGQPGKPKTGAVICPVMNGTRCMLVEIQALTATGFLGSAKRKSSGLDAGRLAMLIAVLEQHAGLRLADRDVFAQSAQGLKVAEPAADLALLLAIAGASARKGLEPATAVIGEVGLGAEVRSVTQLEPRVAEAARLGFTRILVPAAQEAAAKRALKPRAGVEPRDEKPSGANKSPAKNAEIVGVRSIAAAMDHLT